MRRLATALALGALLASACTIEQDLTPIVEAGDDGSPSPSTSPSSASSSSDGPTDGASPSPGAGDVLTDTLTDTVEPSPEPSVSPSPEPSPVPGNRAPSAGNDTAATDEDSPVTISVLGNDRDPDGDPLSVQIVQGPSRGQAGVSGTSIQYVPAPNANGTDRFTYRVSDGRGGSDTATVTVTVRPVNDPPVAEDDSATTDEDTPVTIDVLANDSDIDGDSLTIASVGSPSSGSASIVDGAVRYSPARNATGTDRFTYAVRDAAGAEDTATVTVNIGGTNDPPDAVRDYVSTNEDTPVTIDVLANDTDPDGDALTVVATGPEDFGTARISNNKVVYTPDPNQSGTDTFSYTIEDAGGLRAIGSVEVTVRPVNDPPSANGDSATVPSGSSTIINVVANDSDIEGDSLSVSSVTQPSGGSASVASRTSVQYTASPNFTGTDQFTYTISDGNGGTDTATVTITVTQSNRAPTANPDGPIVVQDGGSVFIDVIANDTDPDGDSLYWELVSAPSEGSVSVVDDRTAQYTHTGAAYYFNTDSFQYRAVDPDGARSNTVTVSIHINQAPVARDDSVYLETKFNVITGANTQDGYQDYDPDGDSFSLVSHTQLPSGEGTVSCSGSGACTYTPPGGCGTSGGTFKYTIRDSRGGEDTATVSVSYTIVC